MLVASVIGILVVVVVVLWFFVARTPEDLPSVREPWDHGGLSERGHFGPSDAGAEPQRPDP